MPVLLPLKQFSNRPEMSSGEEMEENPAADATAPIDLTVKSSNVDNRFCHRASSIDSLITNESTEENEGDCSDAEAQFQGFRPRLPTADMVLMLKKYNKRREASSRYSSNVPSPLNLSIKDDDDDGGNNTADSTEPYYSSNRNGSEGNSSPRGQNCARVTKDNNKFDWLDYRRSMSCSQIDFRLHRRLSATKVRRKQSVNSGKYFGCSAEFSSELPHDHDDGFHDEVDCTLTKVPPEIRSSPVKKLLHNKCGNGSLKRQDSGFMMRRDTNRILMNEPPESFVRTLECLSFDSPVQKPHQPPLIPSLTDQYLPHCAMPMDISAPVDAFGYYTHLMQRIQMHKAGEENVHHSTPNLSDLPTGADEACCSVDPDNILNTSQFKKRPTRALTGRHVREGTGASPSTLVSLRKAIEERQRNKKTDLVERKSYSKKKYAKSGSIRPRAYSASVPVRTVAEDNESDTISVASE